MILARAGLTTNLLVETLRKHFGELVIVLEVPESAREIFKRRRKHVGLFSALGQAVFVLTVPKFLRRKNRIAELLELAGLSGSQNFSASLDVINLNNSTIDWTDSKYKADVVFVNGTRLLSENFLANFSVPIVNIHTGINPEYRGVHGGYWALYSAKSQLFGTTLHLVDTGTDTGTIIDQKILKISDRDNYMTYPILQYLAGLEMLEAQISEIKLGKLRSKQALSSESKLWFHPTIFQYLAKRISKGLK